VALASTAACIVSPQPEPPSVDVTRVTAELLVDDAVRFVGASGAVSAGGATLSIASLESAAARTLAAVADDGRFEAVLAGRPGQTFRLQPVDGDRRGAAVDVVVPDRGGPVIPAAPPEGECLTVEPAAALDFGGVPIGDVAATTVILANACEGVGSVLVEAVYLVRRREAEDACALDVESCFAGRTPESEACHADHEACTAACDGESIDCLDAGTPPPECIGRAVECAGACGDRRTLCTLDACGQVRERCLADRFRFGGGFDLNLPLDVPLEIREGQRRSVVVTFTPFEEARAGDLLVLEVAVPRPERRVVVLAGEGLD
jgi:hypothetical protein